MGQQKELEVFGALLQGYAVACLNLNIVAGRQAEGITADIEIMRWYPFSRLKHIETVVLQSYNNSAPILEKVGAEMMYNWYHYGPGKEIINSHVGFLHFQSGAQGYASVVNGPRDAVGAFELVELDEAKGHAVVHSTTPLSRDAERGVLIGGMSAPGTLDYIDVNNNEHPDYFIVEFH